MLEGKAVKKKGCTKHSQNEYTFTIPVYCFSMIVCVFLHVVCVCVFVCVCIICNECMHLYEHNYVCYVCTYVVT